MFRVQYVLYYELHYLKTDNKLFLLEAGKLAISQEPEGLVTGHLDTGFSWFPWVLE